MEEVAGLNEGPRLSQASESVMARLEQMKLKHRLLDDDATNGDKPVGLLIELSIDWSKVLLGTLRTQGPRPMFAQIFKQLQITEPVLYELQPLHLIGLPIESQELVEIVKDHHESMPHADEDSMGYRKPHSDTEADGEWLRASFYTIQANEKLYNTRYVPALAALRKLRTLIGTRLEENLEDEMDLRPLQRSHAAFGRKERMGKQEFLAAMNEMEISDRKNPKIASTTAIGVITELAEKFGIDSYENLRTISVAVPLNEYGFGQVTINHDRAMLHFQDAPSKSPVSTKKPPTRLYSLLLPIREVPFAS